MIGFKFFYIYDPALKKSPKNRNQFINFQNVNN